MTPEQFIYWLDGFLTNNPYPDAVTIREKMEIVRMSPRVVPFQVPTIPNPVWPERTPWPWNTIGGTKNENS